MVSMKINKAKNSSSMRDISKNYFATLFQDSCYRYMYSVYSSKHEF